MRAPCVAVGPGGVPLAPLSRIVALFGPGRVMHRQQIPPGLQHIQIALALSGMDQRLRQIPGEIIADAGDPFRRVYAFARRHDPVDNRPGFIAVCDIIQYGERVHMLAEPIAVWIVGIKAARRNPAAVADRRLHRLGTPGIALRHAVIAKGRLDRRALLKRAEPADAHQAAFVRLPVGGKDGAVARGLTYPIDEIPLRVLAQQSAGTAIGFEPVQHPAHAWDVADDGSSVRLAQSPIIQHPHPH